MAQDRRPHMEVGKRVDNGAAGQKCLSSGRAWSIRSVVERSHAYDCLSPELPARALSNPGELANDGAGPFDAAGGETRAPPLARIFVLEYHVESLGCSNVDRYHSRYHAPISSLLS